MRTRGRFEHWWWGVAPIILIAVLEYVTGAGATTNLPFGDLPPAQFDRVRLVLLVLGVAAATAVGVLILTRYAGKNEVYGTTATDAATPRIEQSGTGAVQTRYVSDRRLAELATTAFAPPDRIAPWQGHALLRDEVNRRTADSFVAGLIASDALTIDESVPAQPVLRSGSRVDIVGEFEREWIERLLGADGVVTLGEFDSDYARWMEALPAELRERLLKSGWWRSGLGPTLVTSDVTAADPIGKWVLRIGVFALLTAQVVGWTLYARSPLLTALWTMAVATLATVAVIIPSWPSRSADGSAYALQVESFRRFMVRSESTHVERAWDARMVREYGAWAIAIGDADAWRPEIARAQTQPRSRWSFSYKLPSFRAALPPSMQRRFGPPTIPVDDSVIAAATPAPPSPPASPPPPLPSSSPSPSSSRSTGGFAPPVPQNRQS